MPFHEPGYDELVASKKFKIHESADGIVSNSAAVIITVGTPLHNHIETDLSQIQHVLEGLKDHFRKDQLIILRSTVAPGTTAYVKKWIERNTEFTVGEDLLLCFCPERIAEGVAYKELRSLPQICGSEEDASRDAAGELFGKLAPEIMKTDFITAELVNLELFACNKFVISGFMKWHSAIIHCVSNVLIKVDASCVNPYIYKR